MTQPSISRVRLPVALGAFLSLACLPAAAQALLVVGPNDAPAKYYMDGEQQKGFILDIVEWCLDDMGADCAVKLYPWPRAYQMALDGKAGVFGLSVNSERLAIFDYSQPIFTEDLMVIVKKGREFPFAGVEDLRGKYVGAVRGASYGDVFDKAVKDGVFKIEGAVDVERSFVMLAAGRLDAVLFGPGEFGLRSVLAAHPGLRKEDYSILPVPFKRDSKHLGFLKKMGMTDFIRAFDASLEKAKKSGVVEALISRYY